MSTFDESVFKQHCSFDSVTSLRRIQALYGAIAEATTENTGNTRDTEESIVADEYQLYVTPSELDGFTTSSDDDKKLVTVCVDITEDTPKLDGINIRPLRPEIVPKLGFSRYPWGRGIDHSITRRGAKGGSARSTTVTYCVDCLERWTNADGREPAVGQVAEEHDDGWIVRALQDLGTSQTIEDEIENAISPQMDSEEKPRVVATVAVRLELDALAHPPSGEPEDGYYFPGQLDVFNAAMAARKDEKLAEKNTDVPSRGTGTCLVTGDDEEVFGTAEDPLALFTVQHTEKFAELKSKHAWRSHPVSSDAALLIQSGAALIEQCRRTRRGRSVYTIPYFTRMDTTRAKDIKYAIRETPAESQAILAHLQKLLEEDGDATTDDLRFYLISLRNDSGDINVLHEFPDATIQPARRLANAHQRILDGSTFDAVAGFEQPDGWSPIRPGTKPRHVVKSIVTGRYAAGTVSQTSDDDPTTDDTSEWLTFALLAGESVPIGRLLSEYVERLAQQRRNDEDARLSENHLKAQYTQLRALASVGRLAVPDDYAEPMEPRESTDVSTLTDSPECPPADEFLTDDGKLPVDSFREYRLNRFLAERPALSGPQRRAAFLAGVLVGQLGYYQDTERGMERTVLAQYPAEQMTGKRIKRFVPELIHKTNVYAMDNQHRSTSLFPELEDRLPEALSDAAEVGWTLPTEDLRFHYALGQLYGKRATNRAFDLREVVAADAGIDLKTNKSKND
ncbi:TM1802 family CRISPR-associated protein [Halocatena salina]|uniref:Type I-B CRISPR-associated protein Cas8b/Csh1 n=1 Tax=Halocatena salina TaxID=2934340 RepID=A0A8U0A7V6_9EURY|nr:TM1802 family CRISPR-associated protein [Halocatena salina]UPM45281.1 hypothetical protein MW046_19230 [Halocatena salina]